MDKTILPGPRTGTVTAPASKSHGHRLLLCAALSEGENAVDFGTLSEDIAATLRCLQALGAEVDVEGNTAVFHNGIRNLVYHNHIVLSCGESGSTLRFLLPLCGALGVEAEFQMQGRLPERPLAPLDALLCAHGMELRKSGTSLFVRGQLEAGDYSITGSVSSQYITGLLYALPLLPGDSTLTVTGKVESAPYIAMTEDALKQSGIGFHKSDWVYTISGGQHYALPHHCKVEGDCSNAAFFLAMGALSEEGITVRNIPDSSLQGDRQILDLLRSFGAEVCEQGERVTVRRGILHGITIDASNIPDLVPVLSVVAAAAEGETHILNAGRLRIKESDRLRSTAALLFALGAEAEELPDGLRIHGGKALRGGCVDSFHDHRIAMAAAVAASICTDSITVRDALCTDKSYPGFWDGMEQLQRLPL